MLVLAFKSKKFVKNYTMNIVFILIDNTFKFVLLFMFNFIWCTYFFKNTAVRWTVAIGVSLLFCLISYMLSKKKNYKNQISSKEKKRIADILSTLVYMSDHELLDFFYRLASTRHTCTKKNNFITINNESGDVILYPAITNEKLTMNGFAKIIKEVKDEKIKKLVILCTDLDIKINLELDKFEFKIIFLNSNLSSSKFILISRSVQRITR